MVLLPSAQDPGGQVAFITQERKEVIQKLAQASRKISGVPDATVEPGTTLYPRLQRLLTWLSDEVSMSPQLQRQTKVDEGLRLIFDAPNFHFPSEYVDQARHVYEKWDAQSWGARPVAEAVDSAADTEMDTITDAGEQPAKQSRITQDVSSQGQIKLPPLHHPIWGRGGIMHGLAHKRGPTGRKTTVLNPEYGQEQRSGKVYGHNGLSVGAWFPVRLAALFRGAHGHSQAGIHGSPAMGAWSIVVSGAYEHLDQDRGETLHYSGSGSHDNEDSAQPAEKTDGTKSLDTSLKTGRPVRVLRTSEGHSSHAPTEGLRYDGLYRVTDKKYPRNIKGGMYEQFRLERLPPDDEGQIPLAQCRARPNGQDLKDYERIKLGYNSRR